MFFVCMDIQNIPEHMLKKTYGQLSPREKQKADILKSSEARLQMLASRCILAYGLQQCYNIEMLPSISREGLGKPFFADFPDIRFNISHSGCCAGVGLGAEELAIDVQKMRPSISKGVAERVFSPEEQSSIACADDFFALWVRKESYLKALGCGISMPAEQMRMITLPVHEQHFIFRDWHFTCGRADEFHWCACQKNASPVIRMISGKEIII